MSLYSRIKKIGNEMELRFFEAIFLLIGDKGITVLNRLNNESVYIVADCTDTEIEAKLNEIL